MHYDKIFDYIGEMGLYQWGQFAVLFVFAMYCVDQMHIVFVGGSMPHWCRVEELAGLPYDVQKNVAIPTDSDSYSSCEMFAFNYSGYSDAEFLAWNRTGIVNDSTPVVRCTRWNYDQSTFTSTLVSKVRLVKDIYACLNTLYCLLKVM